ncbi:hypothetical protein CC1G_10239 [Coprinopsis cinerea okayama7|uniref:Uncharacterized protein n=1 Tax=Coprinopsis cinerea (strain Okayama-7 / 130 / ATCC MYA-4618 / FGSC 9003) TaxID=240176 RepID=A8NPD3_COPC7|nr:hypothetical protein CC1G_10239 [Coprinopsis cinerea okayama7\|eukprot:XP_001835312.1 hypothetical protein CC1G_10239 [Coprinopsis cinerea okayama7\
MSPDVPKTTGQSSTGIATVQACPMNDLPNELLAFIFLCFLQASSSYPESLEEGTKSRKRFVDSLDHTFSSKILLTHVCARWRTIITHSPTLWQTLHFDASFYWTFQSDCNKIARSLTRHLQLSSDLPLHVRLTGWPCSFFSSLVPFWRLSNPINVGMHFKNLIDSAKRWETLTMMDSHIHVLRVLRLLPTSFPKLKHLVIEHDGSSPVEVEGSVTIAIGLEVRQFLETFSMPVLESIRFDGLPKFSELVPMPPLTVEGAVAKLTRLEIAHPADVPYVLYFLRSAVNLKSLKLELSSLDVPISSDNLVAPIRLDHLEHVDVSLSSNSPSIYQFIKAIVGRLSLSRLEKFFVRTPPIGSPEEREQMTRLERHFLQIGVPVTMSV